MLLAGALLIGGVPIAPPVLAQDVAEQRAYPSYQDNTEVAGPNAGAPNVLGLSVEECEDLLSELGSGSGVEETTSTDQFRYCAAATVSPPGVASEAGSGGEDVGGAQYSDPGEYAYFDEVARPGEGGSSPSPGAARLPDTGGALWVTVTAGACGLLLAVALAATKSTGRRR